MRLAGTGRTRRRSMTRTAAMQMEVLMAMVVLGLARFPSIDHQRVMGEGYCMGGGYYVYI